MHSTKIVAATNAPPKPTTPTPWSNWGAWLADQLEPPYLTEARRWYERAAEAGDITAMVWLGHLLDKKLDPPDSDGASRRCERAADDGNTNAQFFLGFGYDYRLRGWPEDLTEARR